jgi:hypothetical protein
MARLACQSRSRALVTKRHKEHMIEGGELASGLGCSGTILAEPAKFIPRHFVKKSGHNSLATTQKKVLKLSIQCIKSFFWCIELNEIG